MEFRKKIEVDYKNMKEGNRKIRGWKTEASEICIKREDL